MTAKKWKLVVHPLSGNTTLHQFELEAPNWMGALRGARKQIGEEGGLPSGASCAVTPDGVVTVLDGERRRRFVLTPIEGEPEPAPETRALPEAKPQEVKPAKFRTIAYAPSPVAQAAAAANAASAQPASVTKAQASPANAVPQAAASRAEPAKVVNAAPRAASVAAATQASNAASAKQIATSAAKQSAAALPSKQPVVGVGKTSLQPSAAAAAPAVKPAAPADRSDPKRAPEPTSASRPLSPSSGRPKMQLELMLSRDVEPGPENPLTYRERAYLIPKGMGVSEAEAALRFALAQFQSEFEGAPRGRFVNLAAFDHDWIDRPQRPPLVSLEWRDWRGEPIVDYPAAEQSVPPAPAEGDEQLATVFEQLPELAHLKTAAEGLEFSVRLLAHAVGSEAVSGCLYDINTDEYRFVAVVGKSALAAQGRAVPRSTGLFGKAATLEHAALVVPDLSMEPAFDPALEGRAGLLATNMLLRPLTYEGELLGMLQLINRVTGGFSAADVHLVNYLAERLAEFLRDARARRK